MDLSMLESSAISWVGTIIGIIVALLLLSILIKKWTVICAPDELLVVSGFGSGKKPVAQDGEVVKEDVSSGAKVYQSGVVFTIPYFQTYRRISLKPRILDIPLTRLPSSNFIELDIPVNIVYTVGRTPELMQRAAVYLGSDDDIKKLASESAIGEMRSVVASLTTEELITDKDAFRTKAFQAISSVFDEIGLKLMTVNLKDIKDSDNDYIASLARRATAQVVNQAQADVAEQERIGAVRMAEENTLRTTQIAEENRKRDEQTAITDRTRELSIQEQARQTSIGLAEIERSTAVDTATIQTSKDVALAETERDREVKVTKTLADKQVTLAETDRDRKVSTAAIAADEKIQLAKTESNASIEQAKIQTLQVTATNLQEAEQIESATKLTAIKIENDLRIKVQQETANREVHEAALETTTAERSVEIVSAARVEQEQRRINAEAGAMEITIDAKAQSEQITIAAQANADAIIMRGKAEADSMTLMLAAKASGIKAMVEACGGNADTAMQMLYIEQLESLAKVYADAMSNISVDKIIMMGGNGENGTGMLSNLVKDYMGAVPKAHEMAQSLGLTLPAIFGKSVEDNTAE